MDMHRCLVFGPPNSSFGEHKNCPLQKRTLQKKRRKEKKKRRKKEKKEKKKKKKKRMGGPRDPRRRRVPRGPMGLPPNALYGPQGPHGPPLYPRQVYVQKSPGTEVVDNLASFGQWTSFIGAVVATIFAIIGVIVGYTMIKNSDAQVESTATARAPSLCSQDLVTTSTSRSARTRLETRCTTDVGYTAAGSTHQASVETPTRYSAGDTMSVYYEPGSTESEVSATRTPRVAGYIVIGVSVLICLLSWIWYAITKQSKVAAAASGLSSVAGMFRPYAF